MLINTSFTFPDEYNIPIEDRRTMLKVGVAGARTTLRPIKYQWALEAWERQNQILWLPSEVSMADDIRDWKIGLSDDERTFLTRILRFFTQADIDVHDCYTRRYMNIFVAPEVLMMLTAFANAETIHVQAYAYLLDSLGLPEKEYSAFLETEVMKEKHDFLSKYSMDNAYEVGIGLAVYSGFVEGLQLFGSFIMLLHFSRMNKLNGMATILRWSIRDETLHVESLTKLFKTFHIEQKMPMGFLDAQVREAGRKAVDLECAFIDFAFDGIEIEGLTKEGVKSHIRWLANHRLKKLGCTPLYTEKDGCEPLPWANALMSSPEHTNFFEGRTTEYSKGATTGEWDDDVFNEDDNGK